MMAKITKEMNGDKKDKKAAVYIGARPDHKYESDQVALRKVYAEVVKKGNHSLNFNDFDSMTGDPLVQVRKDFVGNKQESYHKPNRSQV